MCLPVSSHHMLSPCIAVRATLLCILARAVLDVSPCTVLAGLGPSLRIDFMFALVCTCTQNASLAYPCASWVLLAWPCTEYLQEELAVSKCSTPSVAGVEFCVIASGCAGVSVHGQSLSRIHACRLVCVYGGFMFEDNACFRTCRQASRDVTHHWLSSCSYIALSLSLGGWMLPSCPSITGCQRSLQYRVARCDVAGPIRYSLSS
jgi:hypothetical protein